MTGKDITVGMLKVTLDLAWGQASALLQQCATIEEARERFQTAMQIVSHNSFDRTQTGIDRLIQKKNVSEFIPKLE